MGGMIAVWIWIAGGLLAVLVVTQVVIDGYRVSKMSALRCPHCAERYGMAVAWKSRQYILHISWEPDAKPRFGELEDNWREYRCSKCGRRAKMNLYGERDTLSEQAEEGDRQLTPPNS
jgi:hypothetical protein